MKQFYRKIISKLLLFYLGLPTNPIFNGFSPNALAPLAVVPTNNYNNFPNGFNQFNTGLTGLNFGLNHGCNPGFNLGFNFNPCFSGLPPLNGCGINPVANPNFLPNCFPGPQNCFPGPQNCFRLPLQVQQIQQTVHVPVPVHVHVPVHVPVHVNFIFYNSHLNYHFIYSSLIKGSSTCTSTSTLYTRSFRYILKNKFHK